MRIVLNILYLLLIARLLLFELNRINIAKRSKKKRIALIIKPEKSKSYYFYLCVLIVGITYIVFSITRDGLFAWLLLSSSDSMLVLICMVMGLRKIVDRFVFDSICDEYIILDSKKSRWNEIDIFEWEEYYEGDIEGVNTGVCKLKFEFKPIHIPETKVNFLTNLSTKILLKLNIIEHVEEKRCLRVLINETDKVNLDNHLLTVLKKK